ncbi:MAG: hypothetical protein HY809_06500 [Nitrospirae bacterium]|nr:hypothetical protein [Nitrospirota bacterium]
MKRVFGISAILFTMLFLSCTAANAFFIRYDGPYEGRVIDSETKEPVEGVVVLGVWYEERPNVAGSNSVYYDAKETVTDKNGEFKIEGLGLKMFSYVGMMQFMIFKAGYQYESGPWESLKVGLIYQDTVKWEGDKPIIPLKKLTMEERESQSGPPSPPHEAAKEKIKLMVGEINKDRADQGLKPIDIGR